MGSYQDLKVWQVGMQLAERCYRLTKGYPRQEMFGMTSQIRRAAVAVPANMAEGWGREGTREYIQYLRVAQGSLKELETHLILCQRVAIATESQIGPIRILCTQVGKMLRSLISTLQQKLH